VPAVAVEPAPLSAGLRELHEIRRSKSAVAIICLNQISSVDRCICPENETRQNALKSYPSAPPQLEPAPAVQPKQWCPVAMGLNPAASNDSISQIVTGFETGMSSI
jgi:hypothetical protein